ncbi:MAG: redoxin domain-containing protein [Gemmataceae bacterium]
MMRRFAFSGGMLAAVVMASVTVAAEGKARTVQPFTLKDGAGTSWSFAEQRTSKAVVVLFLGTECPVNNQYLPTLAQLHKEYAPKGVTFVGVNSNVQDGATRVLAHARANGLPFPVLKDSANVVADDFKARRTPEAFVVTPDGRIVYQGRIDDQIGVGFRRKAATRRDVAMALDELLAGKPVSQTLTDAPGCLIARVRKPAESGAITYAKQVSRIVQNRCQECHRPGQVAPMPLMTYEDVVSWQEMIAEVVEERRMPPWHADAKHGTFVNDRSLTAEERKTLLDWIKAGCPKGDVGNLPAEKTWAQGWTIGKPDAVFEMPTAFPVPAEAGPKGVSYKYFVVPTNFAEDHWVQAAEARPGAREVVHHIIVYVVDRSKLRGKDNNKPGRPTESDTARRDNIGNGFLTAYAPGDMPLVLEPGRAKRIPKARRSGVPDALHA